jgi:hypothetical protein
MEQTNSEYILSGTGCKNLFEMKIAFDAMRNYMYCKYDDAWDHKRIAEAVNRIMYDQPICNCAKKCQSQMTEGNKG